MGIEKTTQPQRLTNNTVIGADNAPFNDVALSVYGKIKSNDQITGASLSTYNGGLTLNNGGINLNNGNITNAGSVTVTNGLTVNNGLTVSTGGLTVSNGGITVSNGTVNATRLETDSLTVRGGSFVALEKITQSDANDGDTIQWSSSQNKWIPVDAGGAGKILAWAYIDCSQKSGSYVRPANSSIVTLTIANHGFDVGSTINAIVYFEGGELNGSSVDNEVWNVTIATANTITFDCGVSSADERSGNVASIHSPVIRGSNNVSSVVLDVNNVPFFRTNFERIRFTLNFANPLINSNYAVIGNAYYYAGGGIQDGPDSNSYAHGAFVQVDNRPDEKKTTSFKFVVVDPTENTYATERDNGNWPFIHLMVVGN